MSELSPSVPLPADGERQAPSRIHGAGIAIPYFPFWPRIFATVVDSLVLGSVFQTVGVFAGSWLAELGPWGRLLGGLLGACYFGIGSSRLTRGRTLGKRLLGIEVRRLAGGHLSVPAALLRATVLMVLFAANGSGDTIGRWSLPIAGSLLLFGISAGILYFFLFNRPTRRSLHDFVARSIVVYSRSSDSQLQEAPPTSRAHFAIFGAFLVASAVLIALLPTWVGDPEALLTARAHIAAATGASTVSIVQGSSLGQRRNHTWVNATAVTYVSPPDREELANRIAAIVLRDVPAARTSSRVGVTISTGYDVVFARSWKSQNWEYTPVEWRLRLARGK